MNNKSKFLFGTFAVMFLAMFCSVYADNYSISATSTYYTNNLPEFSVSIRNGTEVNNYTVTDAFLRVIEANDTRKYNITFFDIPSHNDRTYLNYNFSASGDLKGVLTFVPGEDEGDCIGVKAVIFSALLLFGIAIVVLAAFALINNTVSLGLVILLLGLALAIILGFVVIGYVGAGICSII